jgi:hypothetical protein
VQLTVKGQTTNLLLRLQAGAFNETTFDLNRKRATPPSFALWGVLQNSGLLRASSDLSRVKVKRAGSQAQAQELTLDCSSASSPGVDFWLRDGDFWLRDGDVVEVPERQAASNALGSQ